MKLLLILLSSLLFTSTALAQRVPFNIETDNRFLALEQSVAGGTLASAKLLVGSSGNVATARTVTGDVTISNTGVTAIGADKVLTTMVLDGTLLEADLTAVGANGLHAHRTARATLNCAASGCSVGAHLLGVSLPAKALITRSYIYVKTQFTDTGTCTVAVSCEDANNIKTATDITGTAAAGFIEGQSTGAASAFVAGIASTCEITATIADGGSCVPANGYANIFVEYQVID